MDTPFGSLGVAFSCLSGLATERLETSTAGRTNAIYGRRPGVFRTRDIYTVVAPPLIR
jgi:hypothetical protein